jgi:hypothetical protein
VRTDEAAFRVQFCGIRSGLSGGVGIGDFLRCVYVCVYVCVCVCVFVSICVCVCV